MPPSSASASIDPDGSSWAFDTLEAEAFGPLGEGPLCVVDTATTDAVDRARAWCLGTQAVIVGIDRMGALPPVDTEPFDVLLTIAAKAPRPWVSVPAARLDNRIAAIRTSVQRSPIAASVACRVMRMSETISFAGALHLESLAYSTLLGGSEFDRWRVAQPLETRPEGQEPFVIVERDGDGVSIALARPDTRNAMSAGMRDALFEALAAVLDDPTAPSLSLSGRGPCFSVGGDLAEFGTARDLAAAHAIRTARSCALLLHRLSGRAEAVLHGACIGSGIEIAAAAGRRIGRQGVFFQLPELSMGLMPGAAGTVTLPRLIGRHRTAAMLLTGRRLNAATALEWGLLTGMRPA